MHGWDDLLPWNGFTIHPLLYFKEWGKINILTKLGLIELPKLALWWRINVVLHTLQEHVVGTVTVQEREVKLPTSERSCVIHKCYPGTNHFVRVYAVGADDSQLDRSRVVTIQTSAPPDPPNVTTRLVIIGECLCLWNMWNYVGSYLIYFSILLLSAWWSLITNLIQHLFTQ